MQSRSPDIGTLQTLIICFALIAFPGIAAAQNLIDNPTCEPKDRGNAAAPTDWTQTGISDFDWDCDDFTDFGGPGPQDGTAYFGPSGTSFPTGAELRQDVDVTSLAAGIATGTQKLDFEGYFNIFPASDDRGQVILEYLDGGAVVLGSFDTGLIGGGGTTATWTQATQQVTVPVGTVTVRVRILCNRVSGSTCDGYVDNLSLEDAGFTAVGASVSDASALETDATIDFTVTLSSPLGVPVDVIYLTSDVSAADGLDYTATAGTVTIPAGLPSATVSVPLLDDLLGEFDETFVVTLTGANNGVGIGDGTGVGTITDDDGGVPDNLLTNGSCEPQEVNPAAPPTGWTQVGTEDWDCDEFSGSGAPGAQEGAAYFVVSTTTVANDTMEEIRQDVDVTAFAANIAAGTQKFNIRGFFNIFPGTSDRGQVIVEFLDGASVVLGSFDTGPVEGGGTTATWALVDELASAPGGTETVRVRVKCNNTTGTTCDAYIDDLALVSALAAPPPPDDVTPPSCVITGVNPGPPIDIDVLVFDPESGVATIEVLKNKNATVEIPEGSGNFFNAGDIVTFAPPETNAIVVDGVKVVQTKGSAIVLRVTDDQGNETVCDPVLATVSSEVPASFDLDQNYPNPFNPETLIPFALAETAQVRLVIYDVIGRTVVTLVNEEMSAGTYTATWDGRSAQGQLVPSGTYLYRIEAGSFVSIRLMTLVK